MQQLSDYQKGKAMAIDRAIEWQQETSETLRAYKRV
jgi:hypothetical protein